MGRLHEPVEAPASGVKGALLFLGGTVVDERSAFIVDHAVQLSVEGAVTQRWVLVQGADHLPTEDPKIIPMHTQGLARQIQGE